MVQCEKMKGTFYYVTHIRKELGGNWFAEYASREEVLIALGLKDKPKDKFPDFVYVVNRQGFILALILDPIYKTFYAAFNKGDSNIQNLEVVLSQIQTKINIKIDESLKSPNLYALVHKNYELPFEDLVEKLGMSPLSLGDLQK